jgi:hypothetical protein
LQEYPDLVKLIKSWGEIPAHIKQTISTLVEASKK